MEIKKQAWDNFVESIDFESDDTNFKYEFKIMTKKYGRAYIEYCKDMWDSTDMNEDEFCKMNGNIPVGFFKNKIQNG